MNIIKYLWARKHGVSKQFALLYARGIFKLKMFSGGETSTPRLLLSNGGRLLIGGYGENTYLGLQLKEKN